MELTVMEDGGLKQKLAWWKWNQTRWWGGRVKWKWRSGRRGGRTEGGYSDGGMAQWNGGNGVNGLLSPDRVEGNGVAADRTDER